MARHRSSTTSSRTIGWRVVFGAVIVALVWLGIGAFGGQKIGQLSSLQENDSANFLPAEAESTQVAEQVAEFTDSETFPMLVVAERSGGLKQADMATAQSFTQSVPDLPLGGNGDLANLTVGDFLTSSDIAVIPSEDGEALLALVQLDASKAIRLVAEAVRAELGDTLGEAGLTAYITGPGGFVADLGAAFTGIDGILLGVALGVVLLILLIVYRSPILPFAVLFTSVFGLSAAGIVVYRVVKADLITISGQSQGILSILVIGAATDYALLLVSRYKEELHDSESPWQAIKTAWRATIEPVTASAATVILGLLALTMADLKGTSGLGPVAALGITGAYLDAMTFLPAVLLLGRRWIFWPVIPKVDHVHQEDALTQKFGWGRVARMVGNRPRATWMVTALGLVIAALFLPTLKADGIPAADLFLTEVDSVKGQQVVAAHFDAGSGSPVQVIAPEQDADAVVTALTDLDGVADPFVGTAPGAPPKVVDGDVLVQATLTNEVDSEAALDTIAEIRTVVGEASPDALVGGATAQTLDTQVTADRDLLVVAPMITLVVFIVLALLLRSIVAPLLLIIANVLSFGATMGIAAIVFNHIFKFPGGDPTTVLYGFVFLVALGVDYSIFLMTRAREETARLGAREGVLKALTVTAGVITSAGIVLAATFGALAVLPLVFLAQIAFIVAFGVLIDTFVVRSLLVPALSVDMGATTWWPSKLAKGAAKPEAATPAATSAAG